MSTVTQPSIHTVTCDVCGKEIGKFSQSIPKGPFRKGINDISFKWHAPNPYEEGWSSRVTPTIRCSAEIDTCDECHQKIRVLVAQMATEETRDKLMPIMVLEPDEAL